MELIAHYIKGEIKDGETSFQQQNYHSQEEYKGSDHLHLEMIGKNAE